MQQDSYRAFVARHYRRCRREIGWAAMSAERTRRQQQRLDIDNWARRKQAEK